MANFNLTITDEGAAFLANIIANSGNINFSEVRFSSNNYVGSESSLTAGTWGGTFITATPSASVVDNTTINVESSFNNSSFTTDKSLYSIGVIGDDGNGTTALIAVATTSTPEIISQFILNASTYAYDINLSVSSTATITVTASTAGVLYVSDIIDNLASSNTNKPLSAKQGKALQDAKQPKELSSAITIGGVSQTTVEGALGALNKSKTERTEISNVEATTTATDNYASGDYIYVESLGGIYKAITAITSGQTMTPGSNLSSDPVTVGEELAALNSNIEAIVNVYGSKNLLPYPYYETTKSENGLSFTDNGDGTVTVSGTASADTTFICNNLQLNIDKNFILSGCVNGGSLNTYQIGATIHNTDLSYYTTAYDYGNSAVINSIDKIIGNIYIRICSGTAISTPITFRPMIRDARITDSTYVPYAKTNKQLTDDVSALNNELSNITPIGYFDVTETAISGLTFHVPAYTNSNKMYAFCDLIVTNYSSVTSLIHIRCVISTQHYIIMRSDNYGTWQSASNVSAVFHAYS